MVTFGFGRAALGVCAALLFVSACGDDAGGDEAGGDDAQKQAVVDQYAALVLASYDVTVEKAQALKTAIDAFVKAPSAAGLESAKKAWLASRDPYSETEAYRFYDGPIDNPEDGPEGFLNGWPLSESHIDSVKDDENAGIVNDRENFPTLSKELLLEQNECCGGTDISETNISTGYHAIEFLLWGQDLSATGPGNRPYTDYLVGEGATRPNGDRRGQYLQLAAELLVEQLVQVRDAWTDGKDNYRKTFVAQDPNAALRNILKGMTDLAGDELSGERMRVAWLNEDQEDEHSCFSDNTHHDIAADAKGIENVYRGAYLSVKGPSLHDLVLSADAALAADIDTHFKAVSDAITGMAVPFDQAIRDAEKKKTVKRVIDALVALNDKLLAITPALELNAQ